ncbi:MAG TPA: uroporphyrinogen-III C-methyltransferase [Terriglobales bacterium]|nr:uroporphyrinogen-III C-methyltransferase [Terriglobales bacterium]
MGKVYLVGAGPGDPELLTVKAVRILASADIVLHDALVTQEILELVSPKARIIDVGKRCGQKLLTQDEINAYLIHASTVAGIVVRLKSGDPLIFGRAGEEIEALKNGGVDFEIIPGITSALAAAAAARVSLTDRRLASQVLFTTAHRKGGGMALDWTSAITPGTTVVVYMPGAAYAELGDALIQSGLDPQTPCVIVSCAARKSQQMHWTDIAGLWKLAGISAPALLIVGRVARSQAETITLDLWKQLRTTAVPDEQHIA